MSKHTPGPWAINKYGSIGAGPFASDPIIATVEPFYGPDQKHGSHADNARRIVAAINATAGIPTEALEADVVKRMKHQIECAAKIYKGLTDHKNFDDQTAGFIAEMRDEARALLAELDQ